jgi:hypothetical protein
VTFAWEPSVDPDGDPVTYLFVLDTDPSFAGAFPVPVSGTSGRTVPSPDAHSGLGFLVSGIALAACLGGRGRLRTVAGILVVSGTLAAWAGSGCGGGGSSAQAPASATITHTESGLVPNTAYYWKVAAQDGTAASESGTRSFTTGNF